MKKKRILFSIPFNFSVIYWKIVVLNTKIGRLCIFLCYQLYQNLQHHLRADIFIFWFQFFHLFFFFPKSMQTIFFFLEVPKKIKSKNWLPANKEETRRFIWWACKWFFFQHACYNYLSKINVLSFFSAQMWAVNTTRCFTWNGNSAKEFKFNKF